MSHCAVIGARHTERVLACVPGIPIPTRARRVSGSPAPPGLSLEARAPRGSCAAKLLHGVCGMAWLSSARRGRGGAGTACFVSPALVLLPMCVLLAAGSCGVFFPFAKEFYGYLVVWLG